MTDPFRPRTQPARSIYDLYRWRRANGEGEQAHVDLMLAVAREAALKFGYPAPTFTEVADAERLAVGHTDYLHKWVCAIVFSMHKAREVKREKERMLDRAYSHVSFR